MLAKITNNYIDPDSAVISQSIPSTTINRKNCHSDSFKKDYLFEEIIEKCSHDFSNKNNKENKSRTIYLAGDSHSYQLRIYSVKLQKNIRVLLLLFQGIFPPTVLDIQKR